MKNKPLEVTLSNINTQYVNNLSFPNADTAEDKLRCLVNQARIKSIQQGLQSENINILQSFLDATPKAGDGTSALERRALDLVLEWLPDTVRYVLSQRSQTQDVPTLAEIDRELGARVQTLLANIVQAEHLLTVSLYRYFKLKGDNVLPNQRWHWA